MTDFSDRNSADHPESPTFGTGMSVEQTRAIGQAWNDRGWKSDHLAPTSGVDGFKWDAFKDGANGG